MSAEALQLAGLRAAVRQEARPVYFKVTRRVDARLLGRWRQWAYELLCRKAPEAWRVPPIVPMERGGFPTFAEADGWCTSPDDQIRVLPWGWAYAGDELDADIVCRPRDPKDRPRYLALREKYGDEAAHAPPRAPELMEAAEEARRAIEASYE